jgi:hypothetical protein
MLVPKEISQLQHLQFPSRVMVQAGEHWYAPASPRLNRELATPELERREDAPTTGSQVPPV